jgi:hypothetical protein
MAVTRRREKDAAACGFGWAGPLHGSRQRKEKASCVGLLGPRRSWANGFSRAGRERRVGSSGLRLAARRGLGRKAESQRGEWKEIFHFFFSFSNISNAFFQ